MTMPKEAVTDRRTKVAFVTGGKAGIGKCIAQRLHREGFAVAVFDRDSAGGQTDDNGIGLNLVGDVSDKESVNQAIARCVDVLGSVDVLVNNAGICPVAPAVSTSIEDFQETMRVNVEGTFVCSQAVIPLMIERHQGCIVNMSSWIGRNGQPYFAAYSASKAAIIGLTQAMAKEVAAFGIRINAVCPGIVASTKMRRDIELARSRYGLTDTEERLKHVPIGRAAEPDDITGLVSFLASDEARYLVGETISVSGGIR